MYTSLPLSLYIYIYIYIYIYHWLPDGVGTNMVFTEGPQTPYIYFAMYSLKCARIATFCRMLPHVVTFCRNFPWTHVTGNCGIQAFCGDPVCRDVASTVWRHSGILWHLPFCMHVRRDATWRDGRAAEEGSWPQTPGIPWTGSQRHINGVVSNKNKNMLILVLEG